jgi:hypothetical protein
MATSTILEMKNEILADLLGERSSWKVWYRALISIMAFLFI